MSNKRGRGKEVTTFDFNWGINTVQIESRSRFHSLNRLNFKKYSLFAFILFFLMIFFFAKYIHEDSKVFNKVQYINRFYESMQSFNNDFLTLKDGNSINKVTYENISQNKVDIEGMIYTLENGGVDSYSSYRYIKGNSTPYVSFEEIKENWLSIQEPIRVVSMSEFNFGALKRITSEILSADLDAKINEVNVLILEKGIDSKGVTDGFASLSREVGAVQLLLYKIIGDGHINENQKKNIINSINTVNNLLDTLDNQIYDSGQIDVYNNFIDMKKRITTAIPNSLNYDDLFRSLNNVYKNISIIEGGNQSSLASIQRYRDDIAGDVLTVYLYLYAAIASSILFFLLCIVIALSVNERNRSAARAAKELRKNQNNNDAIQLLLKQINPLTDGDLTKRVYVSDKFVMQIAEKIDYTRIVFADMIDKVRETSLFIADNANKTDETSKKLLEVSTSQFENMSNFIDKISLISDEIVEIVEDTKSAQKNSIISQEVSKTGEGLVRLSIDKMNEIRIRIQESAKKIKKSSESAQVITEVVDLIRNITKQIEVLSLNAAIQAASSGEAGKEFSIVAQEVKRLADDSKLATESILRKVQEVKDDINRAVSSMEETTQEVVNGAKYIENVGDSLKEINDNSRIVADSVSIAAKKLFDKSSEMSVITLNIRDLQATTEKSKEHIRETAKQVEGLKELSKELLEKIRPYKIKK